jgi:hypothetical protein
VSINSITVAATPDAVFDVLDDVCAYPGWVVGAREIRSVDPEWPAPGSGFRHEVGVEDASLHDSSEVVSRRRPAFLDLEVRFRPFGVARVVVRVQPVESGSRITMEEIPVGGPARWLPWLITEPMLQLRNMVSLQRLRHEVESRNLTRRDR